MIKIYMFFLIGLIVAVVVVSGCKKGLYRNSLEKWETVKFPTLGIEMEAPVDRELQELNDNESYKTKAECVSLHFEIHPVYTGTISDTPHLIVVYLTVINKDNYESFVKNKHYQSQNDMFQDKTFNSEITEYPFPSTSSINFRKDVKSKNGDVALCSITYRDKQPDNQQYRDEDIAAIKRILNSIKFIDNNK